MYEDFLIHNCEIRAKTPVNTGGLSTISETKVWDSKCRLWEPNQRDLRLLDKIKDVSLPVLKLYLPKDTGLQESHSIKIDNSDYKIVYIYTVFWKIESHHIKAFISKVV